MTHRNIIEIGGSPGLIFHHSESQWLLYNSRNIELKTKGQCYVERGSEMCSFFLLEGGTLLVWYPQHPENFTLPACWVGRECEIHHNMKMKRPKTRTYVANTAMAQVSAGRRCGLSPENQHGKYILVLFMGLSVSCLLT